VPHIPVLRNPTPRQTAAARHLIARSVARRVAPGTGRYVSRNGSNTRRAALVPYEVPGFVFGADNGGVIERRVERQPDLLALRGVLA